MSRDWIRIEELRAIGVIGLHEHERRGPQAILIDASVRLDLRDIARTDNVCAGVNYKAIAHEMLEHAQTSERHTIEALASDLAGVCLHHAGVHEARIAVCKPDADPYARRVVAEVCRSREDLLERVYIVMGSNAEPERNLPEAAAKLGAIGRVLGVSPAYQTPAEGDSVQADYVNAAVMIETCLPPAAIRGQLKQIELDAGRENGTRDVSIDLDLCLYGDLTVATGGVCVPRPEIETCAYVARTLSDLDPALVHPVTGELIAEIAARLSHDGSLHVREDIDLNRIASREAHAK